MFHKFLISFFCCMSSAAYAIGLNESVANSLPIEESITISMHTSNKAMGESLFINSSEQRQLQLNLVETQLVQLHLRSNNQLERIYNPVSGENKSRRILSVGAETSATFSEALLLQAQFQYKANEGKTPRVQRKVSLGYSRTLASTRFSADLQFTERDAQAALSKLIDVYTPPVDMEDIDDVEATHVRQTSLSLTANSARFNSAIMLVSAKVNNPMLKDEYGVLTNQSGDYMQITYVSVKTDYALSKKTKLIAHAAPTAKTCKLTSEKLNFTAYKIGAKTILSDKLETSFLIKRGAIKAYQLSDGGDEKLALNFNYKLSTDRSLKLAMSQPTAKAFGGNIEARMLITSVF